MIVFVPIAIETVSEGSRSLVDNAVLLYNQ
jgi:hypothetical protein